jgi:MFS family permease
LSGSSLEDAPDAPLSVMIRFAAGRSIGVVGRQMLSVAVGYELYERTHSAFTLGLVGGVQVIPVFALFVPGGILVDRFDRRRLSAVSMFVAALACLLLAFASWSALPLGAFYAVLLLLGSAGAIQSPASSSLLPMLVGKAQLPQANAIRTTGFEIASIAGPAIAGFMLGAISPGAVYALSSALCAISAASYATLPKPRVPPKPQVVNRSGDLLVGLRFIFRSPLLLPALTLDMFAVLFAGATALLPVFAKDVLHVGPQGLGWLRAAPAAGAVVMALVGTRLPPWKNPGRVLLIVVVGYGVATIGFGLSRDFGLSLALLAVSGALDNISVIIRLTLEQVVVPDEIRGRVGAVHYVFIGMSNELGELESGIAAALIGAVPAVVLGGAVAIAWTAVVAVLWPKLRALKPLHELKATPEGAG